MKLQIVGFEANEGMGKASGKAYAMGALHSMAVLAPAFTAEGVSKGQMGTTYDCPVPLVRKVAHLQVPFYAEVETRDIMRFGKRQTEVVDITPVETVRKTA